ncbi:helix-turn-helix domain-containing protein [Winogradskyella psychrotolerans]|uniref:helix-turn-helix domain-containing protein n=1 Tax=Winogradskyella psychrotolerans TaxID=1344585 RepID=UPI001C068CB8|nr:AraC family transcriptional regulator [Winogradskyella psychrotolerans]MBU2928608.1 AraC family transcriptional regulator [Winogradskyella psychrotolerans]
MKLNLINIKSFYHSNGFPLRKICGFVMLSLLWSIHVHTQQNDLVLKAEELVYSNPVEAIKIADHISNISQGPNETATANLLLAKSFLAKGDYDNAIIFAFDDINQSKEVDVQTQIENNILKATLLRKLYLDTQSIECLNIARTLNSENLIDKETFEFNIFLEHINMLLDRLNIDEAIAEVKASEIQFNSFLNNNVNKKRAHYLVTAKAYNSLTQYDSAFAYIDKTFELLNTTQNNNLYEKALIYKESGLLFLQNKEFKKSKETLFIALQFAEILDNPFLLEQIHRGLAINYLASNQNNQHNVYYKKFLNLNTTIEEIEQQSVNTYFNIISSQEESQLDRYNSKYNQYLFFSFAVAIFIVIIGILILIKSENRKKRRREIINYLEVSRNIVTTVKPTQTVQRQTNKRLVIPEETEQNILLKLQRFERSLKYLSKDMSLALLAGQFETNTKYLSEIINKNYNDNFNTFINKLRINYIIEKLKNDTNYINYKISFLADESGFSSHSNFTTVFKGIVGMSPATFINLLKIEREEIINNKKT